MAEGFIGMEDLKANLKKFHDDLSGPGMETALQAAAGVFRDALESATPVATGQARRNVIIYRRKERGITAEFGTIQPFLVGYEKRHAYYMYWYEKGSSHQAAQPYMRDTYDSAYDQAWKAAEETLKSRIG